MTTDPEYTAAVYSAPLATNEQLREQKLTVPQVAVILGVSRMSVYRLVNGETPDGEPLLASYRVGPSRREIRVPISAVREYLANSQHGSPR